MDDMIKLLLSAAPTIFSMGAVYGLIRSDLKSLRDKFDSVNRDIGRVEHSAARSHERIDEHIKDYHRS